MCVCVCVCERERGLALLALSYLYVPGGKIILNCTFYHDRSRK